MINIGEKIKQIFCRHQKVGPYRLNSAYRNIQGETVFWICEDCKKIVKTEFYRNEEYYKLFRE